MSGKSTPPILESYDSVVVGAGVGGLVCASLLREAGRSVLLLDESATPQEQRSIASALGAQALWACPSPWESVSECEPLGLERAPGAPSPSAAACCAEAGGAAARPSVSNAARARARIN